jgi:hypothetical protein
VLDRVLARLAPGWAQRRARARALRVQRAADLADPARLRVIDGERWVRVRTSTGDTVYWTRD